MSTQPRRMVRRECPGCGRNVPVSASEHFRVHPVIPGGQSQCAWSRTAYAAPELPRPRLRTPAELARWTGPRLWVDADLPMG